MGLGPYLRFDGEDYECKLCNRYFSTKKALLSHCRFTSQHEWCERCKRVFRTSRAKRLHLLKSSSHNLCHLCDDGTDFLSLHQLEKHLELEHHHCSRCDLEFDSLSKLRGHNAEHHCICPVCPRTFGNSNELRMHMQTHQPRDRKCYGCSGSFKTFSGIVLHLEYGRCPYGVDKQEVNKIAHRCYQRRKYVTYEKEEPYKCPGCDKKFTLLSGLLQHVEDALPCFHWLLSPQCLGKLKRYMRREVRLIAQIG